MRNKARQIHQIFSINFIYKVNIFFAFSNADEQAQFFAIGFSFSILVFLNIFSHQLHSASWTTEMIKIHQIGINVWASLVSTCQLPHIQTFFIRAGIDFKGNCRSHSRFCNFSIFVQLFYQFFNQHVEMLNRRVLLDFLLL